MLSIIKKNLLILLLLLFVAADTSSSTIDVYPDNDTNYVLVFSDEFNQRDNSKPDPTKWKPCQRYHAQWNRWIGNSPKVAFVKNGYLICRAIPNHEEPSDTATMLTGAIESQGMFAFQYGKVEVKMRTNTKCGNFPAVWMKPNDLSIKQYGEIDIVEMFGQEGKAVQSVHTHRSYTLKKEGVKREYRTSLNVTKWHIYGIIWTPERIVWTIDGKEVGSYTKLTTPQMKDEGQWTFDTPFFLRLNQSVGDGHHRFLIPNTHTTYETQFDWIRVYQLRENKRR